MIALSMARLITAGTATWATIATRAASTEVQSNTPWAMTTGRIRRIQPLVGSGSIVRRGAG